MLYPTGYSLEQLLQWCQDDQLIDRYDKREDSVIIYLDGSQQEFSLRDAEVYLKGIFTSTERRNGIDSSDDGNEA